MIIENIEYKLIPINGNKNYFISKDGIVYSTIKKRKLKPSINFSGYYLQGFILNGKQISFFNHRAVALAFIDNPEKKICVNHIDGNKLNNHYSNLEWVTHSENNKHAYKYGFKTNRGDKHARRKVNSEIVLKIRKRFESEKITRKQIANDMGLGITLVENIISRRTWNHI